ncbi:MAG: hypothetical protein ABJF50_22950 [Paracoccaceae bacterium]|uniref:hypothetical protein n=1 Tax=Yoonia sp. TaxID=2212373 RepID=UPI003290C71F
MALEQTTAVEEFEDGLRKLGWLSAYSRQVLMTRHLLRNLAAISYPDDLPGGTPGNFALDLFRCSITILSSVNRETQQFSSPYEPPNRPDTHHLAFRRKNRIFSASIASGMPDVHFHFATESGVGFENSTDASVADKLLSSEIIAVSKGVSLTTKSLADKRVEALRSEKLWQQQGSEDQVTAQAFFDHWHEWAGKNGSFWREWYQGLLDGEPLDWTLQRRVALIDDKVWEAGIEAVAVEIEKIRIIFDLEKRIVDLETDLRRATFDRHGVGGNNPPEMLDDAPIARELVIVWQPLEDLSNEITNGDPDSSRLQLIIESLASALNAGFAWCLKKGDLIVDTAIKWAIPASGTGYLALNPEKLEAVLEAAKRLLGVI